MTTTALWSNLPDDIITHVMAYWCPNKERKYRHIKQLIGKYYNHSNWSCFNNSQTYLHKIIQYTDSDSSKYADKLWIKKIWFTMKSTICISKINEYGSILSKSIIKDNDRIQKHELTQKCRDNFARVIACFLKQYSIECPDLFNAAVESFSVNNWRVKDAELGLDNVFEKIRTNGIHEDMDSDSDSD
jgi:hypothetical protein